MISSTYSKSEFSIISELNLWGFEQGEIKLFKTEVEKESVTSVELIAEWILPNILVSDD